MKAFNRCVARLLIVCTFALGMPLPVSAEIVTTEQIYASEERDRVRSFLDRSDVQAQLQRLGVEPGEAQARVDALTDDEAARIAGHLEQLPAGGSVIGVLFAIFIILLITDILGLTKVFPFTRSVR